MSAEPTITEPWVGKPLTDAADTIPSPAPGTLPPELLARIEASAARLDARPEPPTVALPAAPAAPTQYTLTCGACGHTDTVPADPRKLLCICDQCGARIAYGIAMPKITNVPHPEDARFLQSRIEGPAGTITITLERSYAAQYALDILSVCEPRAYARAVAAPVGGTPPRTP